MGKVRSHNRRRQRTAPEDGMALVLALFFFVVTMGFVLAGSTTLRAHKEAVEINYARYAQAAQLARSGLTEGLGWLRKQPTQPVTKFEPVLEPTADPPRLETDDPDIGLVRDFKITGTTWGRYEVWKEWEADPDLTRLEWRHKFQVMDISKALGTSSGGGWQLRAISYIYQKRNPSVRFDHYPNYVVANDVLEVQVRRLAISPPGQAAINVGRGSNLTVNTQGRVFGGTTGAGVYYPQGTGTPQPNPLSATRVTGNPQFAPTPGTYDDSIEAVFGVTRADLLAMADNVVSDMADFPVPVPRYSIVVVQGSSVHFDATTPLNSEAAIVYIEGNTTVAQGSTSNFNGLLFVDGNLSVRSPSEIKGSIICTGNMTVQGSSDFADIYFDESVLNELRQNIGNYRMSSAMRRPEIK